MVRYTAILGLQDVIPEPVKNGYGIYVVWGDLVRGQRKVYVGKTAAGSARRAAQHRREKRWGTGLAVTVDNGFEELTDGDKKFALEVAEQATFDRLRYTDTLLPGNRQYPSARAERLLRGAPSVDKYPWLPLTQACVDELVARVALAADTGPGSPVQWDRLLVERLHAYASERGIIPTRVASGWCYQWWPVPRYQLRSTPPSDRGLWAYVGDRNGRSTEFAISTLGMYGREFRERLCAFAEELGGWAGKEWVRMPASFLVADWDNACEHVLDYYFRQSKAANSSKLH